MANFARENKAYEAVTDRTCIFGTGAFKNVYKGKYTGGERAGQECVSKIFKSGSVYEESYFEVELKVVDKALEIVNRFNKGKHISNNIWLNKPEVWVYRESKEKSIVEPMITNFEKFNSNTGWTPVESSPWTNAMQALSHFSYHTTNRRELLCDLQGGVYNDGFVLTDPVIMSINREYGPTDLGAEGISTFFSCHKCNKFCKAKWMIPRDVRVYFEVKEGSSMILPTRQSRAPLTSRLPQMFGNMSIQEE